MAISVPPKGDADKKIGAHFAPLSAVAQDTPNLTVKIRAGWFYNTDGDVVEYSGGNSPTITPPASNAKWALIAISDTGSIAVVHGVASATPVLPALPAGHMPLAFVYLTSTATAITNERLFDARPMWRSSDVVSDLAAELADRPTFTDLSNELATKADVDGTPEYSFALNNGDSPAADAMFVVKRGAGLDVAIRWNESTDQWEITNDGTTFDPIGTVGGSFMSTVPGAVDGNVAIFATGEVADSGTALTDLATDAELTAGLALKADDADLTAHTGDATIHFTLPIAQADVTDLVADLAAKADLTGATFTGNVVVDNGVDQPIALASFDAGSSGLLVDRGGPANAILEWDESTDQWMAGVIGSVFPILTAANVALANLTDVDDALAPGAGDVLRFVGGEWTNDGELTTHVADGTIHFTEASIDHTAILNIGTNSHAAIDTHIADATIHFTQAAISITASQVSDFTAASQAVPRPRTTQAAPYAILSTDEVVLMTGTGDATLPAPVDGKEVVVKNIGVGVVTVVPNAAETIDGGASFGLPVQYDSVTVVSDGTDWFVI